MVSTNFVLGKGESELGVTDRGVYRSERRVRAWDHKADGWETESVAKEEMVVDVTSLLGHARLTRSGVTETGVTKEGTTG